MENGMQDNAIHVRCKIWVEHAGEQAFGDGMAELFTVVEACGSLRKAAEQLGMPYRIAWGRVRRAEQALGFPLLVSTNNRHDGMTLTDRGRELLKAFHELQESVQEDLHTAELSALNTPAGQDTV